MDAVKTMRTLVSGALTVPIRVYQLFSRMTPRRCRYHPTCSQYALEAITGHGPLKGLVLAIWRLLRCHPWTPGGYDPVPKAPFRRPE
ncbi:putative membrane protein insertion efficiency factor [compost metagenome]